MSRFAFAVFLSLYTCIGWGLIAPFAVKLNEALGKNFHPAMPFLWTTMGHVFLSFLVLVTTEFEPLKGWKWHWAGFIIFFSWPTASLAIAYAYAYAAGREWIPNAIAATYPALVSLPLLLYFFGQHISFGQAIGLAVAMVGILMTILL